MQIHPIDRPANTGSDIFSGDQYLGLFIGAVTFVLTYLYFKKPAEYMGSLLYFSALSVTGVSAVFFSRLFKKNNSIVNRTALLVPLAAAAITLVIGVGFIWPVFIDAVPQLLRHRPFLTRVLVLIAPYAVIALLWQVLQSLLPGRWWKQTYG